MSFEKEQAESVVLIDEHSLDKECIRLPSDYLKFAHLAADAKRDVQELENRLKVVQCDLDKEVRANPGDYGLEKITETAVQSTVVSHPRYQKGLEKLVECRHQAELAQAVVWALEHKKRTLTLLVELHGLGYFSSPKVSDRGRQAVEEMTKRHVRRSTMHED